MKRSINRISRIMSYVLLMLVIGGCGVALGLLAFYRGRSLGARFVYLLFLLAVLAVSGFLQVILHEAGHGIFGALTGYTFCSFRVGSLMWIRVDGKIRLKRFSLAGTGGQCLMAPPDMVDGKLPVLLYNLGGSLMNLLTGLFSIISAAAATKAPLRDALCLFGIVGILSALINGIPLRIGGIDNDGYNALCLRRNPDAARAFWVQLKVNEQTSNGIRMKDMPMEWFAVPDDEGMKNSLIAALGVFACSWLMDEHRFKEAEQLMARLLGLKSGITDIYRCMMTVDRAYVEMIGENRKPVLDRLLSAAQLEWMKLLATQLCVIRTQYTHALFVEGNRAKADEIRAQFERQAERYPYAGEIQSERELIDIAYERFASSLQSQKDDEPRFDIQC